MVAKLFFYFRSLFQASNEEGASKVFELLQGKAFRSIGWNTLFDCLSIYEQKFKQSLQSTGALLPEFQEGDAKALVAYLNVLQKVLNHSRLLISKLTNSFFTHYSFTEIVLCSEIFSTCHPPCIGSNDLVHYDKMCRI